MENVFSMQIDCILVLGATEVTFAAKCKGVIPRCCVLMLGSMWWCVKRYSSEDGQPACAAKWAACLPNWSRQLTDACNDKRPTWSVWHVGNGSTGRWGLAVQGQYWIVNWCRNLFMPIKGHCFMREHVLTLTPKLQGESIHFVSMSYPLPPLTEDSTKTWKPLWEHNNGFSESR